MDEGLVAVEDAVAAREQVALEPALAEMLGQDLEHPTFGREPLVRGKNLGFPFPRGHREDVPKSVGRGLVRPEDAEVVGIPRDDIARNPPSTRIGSLDVEPGDGTSTA